MVSHTTQEVVTKVMGTVSTKQVIEWIKEKLDQSVQSKRKIVFSTAHDAEQKRDQLLSSV